MVPQKSKHPVLESVVPWSPVVGVACKKRESEGGVRGQGLGREEGSAETDVGPRVASGGGKGKSSGRAGGGMCPHEGAQSSEEGSQEGTSRSPPEEPGPWLDHGSSCLTAWG